MMFAVLETVCFLAIQRKLNFCTGGRTSKSTFAFLQFDAISRHCHVLAMGHMPCHVLEHLPFHSIFGLFEYLMNGTGQLPPQPFSREGSHIFWFAGVCMYELHVSK